MNADPNPAKAIFLEAVERYAPDQWPAFLDRACAGQSDLRGRVEALLEAHREIGTAQHRDLPEGTDPGPVATVDVPPVSERPGTVIGPYKLLEQIGEGGMGTVWMAEQTEPVKRLVAVKLIKAGMDSRQVIARFEAERQALALMDHPNIARVLDAGTTGAGRPYFVMELVKGVPITRYCDEHHLTPAAAAGAVHPGLPGGPARASEGDHPPRFEAVQRAGRAVRRPAGAEGHRLRRGQGDRAAADRRDAGHRLRRDRRHAGIHVARAGGVQSARHRHAQRHLLAGRPAVRAAGRQPAVSAQGAGEGGHAGDAAGDPRAGADEAEHQAEHGGGLADRWPRTAGRSRRS